MIAIVYVWIYSEFCKKLFFRSLTKSHCDSKSELFLLNYHRLKHTQINEIHDLSISYEKGI